MERGCSHSKAHRASRLGASLPSLNPLLSIRGRIDEESVAVPSFARATLLLSAEEPSECINTRSFARRVSRMNASTTAKRPHSPASQSLTASGPSKVHVATSIFPCRKTRSGLRLSTTKMANAYPFPINIPILNGMIPTLGMRAPGVAVATGGIETDASSTNDLLTKWSVGVNEYLLHPWWSCKTCGSPLARPLDPLHFDGSGPYIVDTTRPCTHLVWRLHRASTRNIAVRSCYLLSTSM